MDAGPERLVSRLEADAEVIDLTAARGYGPDVAPDQPAPGEVLSAFYEIDYPQIVAAIVLMGADVASACEAVDEAIAEAWQQGTADFGRSTFAANVRARSLKIARKGSIRRRLERRAGRRAGHEYELRREAIDNAVAIDVRRVLETLSPRQRQVVVLHYLFDMSVDDCAHELGISQSTVKTTLKRARTLLARRLDLTEEEDE